MTVTRRSRQVEKAKTIGTKNNKMLNLRSDNFKNGKLSIRAER